MHRATVGREEGPCLEPPAASGLQPPEVVYSGGAAPCGSDCPHRASHRNDSLSAVYAKEVSKKEVFLLCKQLAHKRLHKTRIQEDTRQLRQVDTQGGYDGWLFDVWRIGGPPVPLCSHCGAHLVVILCRLCQLAGSSGPFCGQIRLLSSVRWASCPTALWPHCFQMLEYRPEAIGGTFARSTSICI